MIKKIEDKILSFISKEEARVLSFKAKLASIKEYIKSLEIKLESFRIENLFK